MAIYNILRPTDLQALAGRENFSGGRMILELYANGSICMSNSNSSPFIRSRFCTPRTLVMSLYGKVRDFNVDAVVVGA